MNSLHVHSDLASRYSDLAESLYIDPDIDLASRYIATTVILDQAYWLEMDNDLYYNKSDINTLFWLVDWHVIITLISHSATLSGNNVHFTALLVRWRETLHVLYDLTPISSGNITSDFGSMPNQMYMYNKSTNQTHPSTCTCTYTN